MRTDVRGTKVRGAGLLLLRFDRLGAGAAVFDADGGGEVRGGGLMLLVAAGAGAGAGESSFRRLAGGLVEVGEGVGRVLCVFEVEFWALIAMAGVDVVRGDATTLAAGGGAVFLPDLL